MSYVTHLQDLLRPLGVYDLTAPFQSGELESAGRALDGVEAFLEEIHRESCLATAESWGLERVSALLEHCGLITDPTSLSLNSAMVGKAVEDPEQTLIQANTSAVIAIREAKKNLRHMDCIGCSRCVEVCPEGLNPMELYRAASTNRRQTAFELGLERCIGCAACSYICPSRLELSHLIREKQEKWPKGEHCHDC